jgi:hypothetical protein
MASPETRVDKDSRHDSRRAGVELPHGSALHPSRPRELLEEHLDRLRSYLQRPEEEIDAGLVRDTLFDLSADIRSGTFMLRSGDYRWILERLTSIYAEGFGSRARYPLTVTAAAYAQVIETISNAYPDQDYGEAVGQLFCYMSRLFRTRERSWKAVYRHIRSIPDTVEAKQLLNRALFVEIQEWAEAGVDNLFSIRRDIYEKIEKLSAGIEDLDRSIEKLGYTRIHLRQTEFGVFGPNVIDLDQARRKRMTASLDRERRGLVEARKGEESVVALIESDIREFEKKLRNTRRAYFVRLV